MGTYGGHTVGKKGYAIHTEISVGSYANHDEEGPALKRRQEAADLSFKKNAGFYQKIFDHYVNGKHPYRSLTKDLDQSRVKMLASDYKIRVSVDSLAFDLFKKSIPTDQPKLNSSLALPEIKSNDPQNVELYLYVKKNTPQYRVNRMLGHFAFSQLSEGGYLYKLEIPQLKLAADISPYLESLIPNNEFALDSDFTGVLRNFMNQISQYHEQVSNCDMSFLKSPEHRILQQLIKALYAQTKLPQQIEADLKIIKEPSRFIMMENFVWLLARDDEWAKWKEFFKIHSEKEKTTLGEYWTAP